MADRGGGGRVETLTVLFTDLVGSTALRSRIGEERSDALRHTHDGLLRDAITAAGGRVVKSTGDGVMATFPGAADAVGAAVAVQQAIDRHNRSDEGERIEVRIGLSVGDVTVEEDGDCFGLPVVEAQRLEAASTPGQILCASIVRALARGRGGHEFRTVGSLELKGLAEPLDVDEVVWEPVVDEADTRPGLPPLLATPNAFGLAGRESELSRLTEAWKRSGEGPGRLVLLSGEPGIGKTRLVSELAATVVASGGIVLAGRSDEDLTTPYGPVADALGWWATAVGPGVDLGECPGELVRLVPDLVTLEPALADACGPATRRTPPSSTSRSGRGWRPRPGSPRCCSSSTTCTGRMRPPSSSSARCSTGRPPSDSSSSAPTATPTSTGPTRWQGCSPTYGATSTSPGCPFPAWTSRASSSS